MFREPRNETLAAAVLAARNSPKVRRAVQVNQADRGSRAFRLPLNNTDAQNPASGFFERRASRFSITLHPDDLTRSALGSDVRNGLTSRPKTLPPKYFYDERGSWLFEQICDTPEYYQTRTENALLTEIAEQLISRARPNDLIEFGSGTARKTRTLLDALTAMAESPRYVPLDVNEGMLRRSAMQLLSEYPELTISGIVGDYDHHLHEVPAGERRLFIFLGSTIGNFEPDHAVRFVQQLTRQMAQDDRFLLGVDLVKDERILNAAYNDAQGITAEFNKNVLNVLNRELDAEFELDGFEHVAFFDAGRSQVEMYLESKRAQVVPIRALDLAVRFESGERVLTEISHKFTLQTVSEMLHRAGQKLLEWHASPGEQFALALSQRRVL